jgi:hypothetical protein
MQDEAAKAEQEMRWLLWKIDPLAYAERYAEEMLEHLHGRPTTEETNARISQ